MTVLSPSNMGGIQIPNKGILEGVTPSDLSSVLAEGCIIQLTAGESFPRSDDENASLFILIEGRMRSSASAIQDADQSLFADMEPGDCFRAETMAEPGGAPLPLAMERSTVLRLKPHSVCSLAEVSQKFAQNFVMHSLGWSGALPTSRRRRQGDVHQRGIGAPVLQNEAWLLERIALDIPQTTKSAPLSLLVIELLPVEELRSSVDQKELAEVLNTAANAICASLRPTDGPVRLSQERMAVLLPDTSDQLASIVARRLANQLRRCVACCDMRIPLPHLKGLFAVKILTAGVDVHSLLRRPANTLEDLLSTTKTTV